MNEIFADGISGIVIANNVVRVELARLRPTGQGDPDPAGLGPA